MVWCNYYLTIQNRKETDVQGVIVPRMAAAARNLPTRLELPSRVVVAFNALHCIVDIDWDADDLLYSSLVINTEYELGRS